MDILIKDGVKYIQTNFQGKECEFEKIVFTQYRHIFGDNTILFTKKKIQTVTGIGTIPDAFLIDFEKDEWFIIEIEISNHDVYTHIVPQLTKFSSALNNSQTRKQLINFFENEIREDPFKNALLIANGKKEVYKVISEIIDSDPELIIIIEQQHKELVSICNLLPFKSKINVFKAFTRAGFSLGDNIFQVEPLFTLKQKIIRQTEEKKDTSVQLQKSAATREINSSNKRGRGNSDVLLEQIIPAIKSIAKNGNDYYATACKEIAAKLGIKNTCISSQCTRDFKLNWKKGDFLEHINNGTIIDILKKRFPHRQDIIDREL